MHVRMELSRILIRELTDFQVIELTEVLDGHDPDREPRFFPIVIGLPEAQAIDRRLKGVEIKRPQTHDLLANVIDQLGGRLESITITNLDDSTFYATLNVVSAAGDVVNIDSRPSDAIALGIAGDVPIFVAEHVLESASRDVDI